MKYLSQILLTLAVSLTLIACSNDSNGGNNNNNPSNVGSATIEVSGAHGESADASASSATIPAGGWVISFGTPTANFCCLVISSEVGGRPGTGSHNIVDASSGVQPGAGEYQAFLQAAGNRFASTAGTLTITSSSSTSVEGSFNITAADVQNTSSTLTVTGMFSSNNVEE